MILRMKMKRKLMKRKGYNFKNLSRMSPKKLLKSKCLEIQSSKIHQNNKKKGK